MQTISQLFMFILFFCFSGFLTAKDNNPCAGWNSIARNLCLHLHHIWTDGDTDLYFSGYAWHNRYTYSPEKIKSFNEEAWGGGMGKGIYDENGNWHGLAAIAFLDSHKNIEPAAGYIYLKMAHFNEHFRAGAGLSLLVTAREDILEGVPFPGILPWLSLNYRKLSVMGSYIPGAAGAGNVFFVIGKWTFGK